MNTFESELKELLDKHSQCKVTPSYILASYIVNMLNTFDEAVMNRQAFEMSIKTGASIHVKETPTAVYRILVTPKS